MFTDLCPGTWAYPYAECLAARNVMTGYSDGTFRPNAPVTRAQAAKMLVSAKGWSLYSPPWSSFTDVPPTHWAYAYVHTALSHGIIAGYADGTFRPDVGVTRAQLAKMVALTVQSAGPATKSPDQPGAKTGPTPEMLAGPKEQSRP
jgi:hypothetical protein